MLEGLTVISTEHIIEKGFGLCLGGYIFFGIALLGVAIFILGVYFDSEIYSQMIGGAMCLGACIIGLGICSEGKVKRTYDIYKVIAEDTVSLNEFNKRYRVLSIDGDIYEIVDWKNSSFGERPNEVIINVSPLSKSN